MAVRPDSADIKYILLKKTEVLVELRDNTQFYDVNPEDRQKQVDYYIEGRRPGEKPIIVLSKSAPQSLLERLIKQPLPIRSERASEREESYAGSSFRRGFEFARGIVNSFEEKIAKWDGSSEIVMNKLGQFSFELKNKAGKKYKATISVQTSRRKDGTVEHRFIELRLNVNETIIIEKRRDVLKKAQEKLEASYDKMLKIYLAELEKRKPKTPSKGSYH